MMEPSFIGQGSFYRQESCMTAMVSYFHSLQCRHNKSATLSPASLCRRVDDTKSTRNTISAICHRQVGDSPPPVTWEQTEEGDGEVKLACRENLVGRELAGRRMERWRLLCCRGEDLVERKEEIDYLLALVVERGREQSERVYYIYFSF